MHLRLSFGLNNGLFLLIMLTDLFSSMDGARSPLLWVIPLLLPLLYLQSTIWHSTTSSAMRVSISNIWVNTTNMRFFFFPSMTVMTFWFLLMNNMLGLSPLTYTLTSDLMTVSSLSVLMWLYLLCSGYLYAPRKSLAHLAPAGAPLGLLPFLVLIETISILIRPLTLTVRLVANISAGHIVLGLIANTLTTCLSSISLPFMVFLMIGYTLFEFFVSIIQAYIMTLLITLYMNEHPYSFSLYKAPNC